MRLSTTLSRATVLTATLLPATAVSATVLTAALVLGNSASAAQNAPTLAALGDSVSQAANSCGPRDCPENSWSTGSNNPAVGSFLWKGMGALPNLTGKNVSQSGARVKDLPRQAGEARGSDFATILIGGNDLCTSTPDQMTSPEQFRKDVTAAMDTLYSGDKKPHVFVASIPGLRGLLDFGKQHQDIKDFWNRGVCSSMLANPDSTSSADEARRQRVDERQNAFNSILKDVCAQHKSPAKGVAGCYYDEGAVFNSTRNLQREDLSSDFFHPSMEGHKKLADVAWHALMKQL